MPAARPSVAGLLACAAAVAVVAAAAGVPAAAAVSFSKCPNSPSKVTVQSVTVDPDPPKAGSSVTVSVSAVSGKNTPTLTAPTATLAVYWYSIPIYSADVNLCTSGGTTCPVSSGSEFTGSLTYDIPGAAGGKTVTVKVTVKDKSGSELECVSAQVTVSLDNSGPVLGTDEELDYLFKAWQKHHGVYFSTRAEQERRRATFAANLLTIEQHNSNAANTFRLTLNQYAHLSTEEFLREVGVDSPFAALMPAPPAPPTSPEAAADQVLPKSVDWSRLGAMTPVRNQKAASGACRSSWAIAGVTTIEAAYYLKTGNLRELSPQQVLDCAPEGSKCSGGTVAAALDFAKANGGLCYEDDYAFVGRNETCRRSCSTVGGSGYSGVTHVASNKTALEAAVSKQPVAITFDFVPELQFYESGVFTGRCASSGLTQRGAVVVGYGGEASGAYWKIQESLGSSWGEQGYLLLARGVEQAGGQCGVLNDAVYPTL